MLNLIGDHELILGRSHLDGSLLHVHAEPSPAGALDSNSSLGHFSLERSKGAEITRDRLSKGAFWFATAIWRHVLSLLGILNEGFRAYLPEDSMVDVSTAVKLDGVGELDALGDITL